MDEQTDDQLVISPPKKKRGRPKKSPNLPPPSQPSPFPANIAKGEGDPPQPTGKKPRPLCEKGELAKYPLDGILVVWGVEPSCKRFKRKGLAILFHPEDPGGQVTLMPVTDDGEDGLRWRYRWVNGPSPYHYEKIDIEPGQAATAPTTLRQVADILEYGVKKFYGGVREADQTTIDYIKERKADLLGDKIRKEGIF